jgi:hypothetical protein
MRPNLWTMRPAMAAGALLILISCSTHDEEPGMAPSASVVCPITVQKAGVNPAVPAFSSGHTRSWFYFNSSPTNVTIGNKLCVKSGNITTCTANNFGSYVPANGQIDGDVTFSVGAAGSGTVSLWVNLGAPCNSLLKAPAWTITIN